MNPNEPQQDAGLEPQAQEPVNYAAPEVQESPVVEPTETIAPVAVPVSATGGPKKDKKKLIVVASIIGGVVLLAILGVVLYTALTSVSKKDYTDAAVQFNKVTTANSNLRSSVSSVGSSGSDSDADFNDSMNKAQGSIDDIKKENDELGKLKAMRFGEGAEQYKEFNDSLGLYVTYADSLIKSVKDVRPALVICSDASKGTTNEARSAALKECSDALGKVGELPNPEFNEYVNKIKTAYNDYSTVFASIAKIENPYGKDYEQYKVLRDKMYKSQDTLREASKEFSKATDEREDKIDIQNKAKELRNFLNEKQY